MPDLGKPRWPGTAAESGIIDSPDFDCAVIPHICLINGPTLSTVCVTIKAQNIYVRITFGSREARLRDPYFQLSVFERNGLANGAARVDRRSCWKQNQVVRQVTEKHHE